MSRSDKTQTRSGRADKRAGILAAARDLFLTDGYERTSVDAIAGQAQVSKRTVYDYYGDKQALLLAVIEDAGQALMVSITDALDQHLREVTDLEAALTGFARQVATRTFATSDFVVLRRLLSAERSHLPDLSRHPVAHAPEDAIAARFRQLADAGRLRAPDARLAAEHFVALTFLLALNNTPAGGPDTAGRVDQAITDGVPVFVRAYAGSPH